MEIKVSIIEKISLILTLHIKIRLIFLSLFTVLVSDRKIGNFTS